MGFRETSGDLFKSEAEVWVNTVNTVGVMGKGIALEFKKQFPDMFEEYQALCESSEIEIGKVHMWSTGLLLPPKAIINLPTKRHWRADSRLPDIDAGLKDMSEVIKREGFTSVAMPPPGCGNGGLDWDEVKPLVARHLGDLPGVEVEVYLPSHVLDQSASREQRLTPGLSALLALFSRFELASDSKLDLGIANSLAFLLQCDGVELELEFEPSPDGPRSRGLQSLLGAIDGLDLHGFNEGGSQEFELNQNAVPTVNKIVADSPEIKNSVERVSNLLRGEDPEPFLTLSSVLVWNNSHPSDPIEIPRTRDEADCEKDLKRLGWIKC